MDAAAVGSFGKLVQGGALHLERLTDPLPRQILGQMFRQKAVEFFLGAAGHQLGHVGLAKGLGRQREQIAGRLQNPKRGAGQLAIGLMKPGFVDAVFGTERFGPLPLRFLVGALDNVAEQQIAHDGPVDLDGGDGLDEAGMTGIDPGFLFLAGASAGHLVAQAAALLPRGAAADQPAIGGQLAGIGENVHPPLVKHHGAQTGKLVKIPQQYQQFFFIKDGAHPKIPLSLFCIVSGAPRRCQL